MNSGMSMLLGVAAGTVLLGVTMTPVWADGGPSCRSGGHAFDMARHGISGHGGWTSHTVRHLLRHQQDLGLTDEQVAKLKGLALDQDRAQILARADVQIAERELWALVADEKTDLSIIEAKVNERESFEAKLSFMRIKAKRDLYAVLTPEQREKQKAIHNRMKQAHRARQFSSQGMDATDHDRAVGGTNSVSQGSSGAPGGSLQTG